VNLDGEHSTLGTVRDLVLVLAFVLALVLPFVLTRQLHGTGSTGEERSAADSATVSPLGHDTHASTGVPSRGTDQAATMTPAEASGEAAALAGLAETCRLANLRQQAPLSAADVSLAQFDKHIDAMNLLVAGKISLSVATTFWDETRVGATQNVAAFHQADREHLSDRPGCPALDPAVAESAPYGQVVAIKSCSSAIAQRAVALARARKAVATWEHHVHDMEMLRMGRLTPAQATAAWHKSWKTGENQLMAYDAAAAKAKRIHCSLD
jgi:hypothetical protein